MTIVQTGFLKRIYFLKQKEETMFEADILDDCLSELPRFESFSLRHPKAPLMPKIFGREIKPAQFEQPRSASRI